MERALEGIRRFPDDAALHIHVGDICKSLKRYEEAFSHWLRAFELDSTYLDALYSMGSCYEELEQYGQAHKVWTKLTRELDRRGLVIEREYPAKQAENCLKRMK